MSGKRGGKKIIRITKVQPKEEPIIKQKQEEPKKEDELAVIIKKGATLGMDWEKYRNINIFLDECDRNPYSTSIPMNMKVFSDELVHVPYDELFFLLDCIIRKIQFFNEEELEFNNNNDDRQIDYLEIYRQQADTIISLLRPEDKDSWFYKQIEDFLFIGDFKSLEDVKLEITSFFTHTLSSEIDMDLFFSPLTSLTTDYCPEILKLDISTH